MVEAAVFADIVTLKEALEFDTHVKKQGDFQLTSCCCPVWIALIRGIYKDLAPHVPGAVSPIIAAGRVVKKLHPDAVTVFVGPCMAKKILLCGSFWNVWVSMILWILWKTVIC